MSAPDFRAKFETIRSRYGLEAPFGLPSNEHETSSIGLNIWTRSDPKENVFGSFIEISNELGLGLNVYADDVSAKIVTGRTNEEQSKVNERYQDFFYAHGATFQLSSDILKPITLKESLEIIGSFSWKEYEKLILSNEKKGNDDTRLSELSHSIAQIALLKIVLCKERMMICGKGSSGIFYVLKDHKKTPLRLITVEKIT